MAPAPGYEVIVSHNPNFKPFMNLASAFCIIGYLYIKVPKATSDLKVA